MQQLGVDRETVEITVETLAPGVHVLFGDGGNDGIRFHLNGDTIDVMHSAIRVCSSIAPTRASSARRISPHRPRPAAARTSRVRRGRVPR